MIEVRMGGRAPKSQRKIAIVDDEDGDLASMGWSFSGGQPARSVRINGGDAKRVKVYLHTEVAKRMGLDCKNSRIGRKNGDPLDARRCNLMEMTPSMIASGSKPKSKTGFKGVSARRGGWIASIIVDGVTKFLGDHKSIEDAARAYDAAAKEHYGDIAYLNFPDNQEIKAVVERTPPAVVAAGDTVRIYLAGGNGKFAVVDGVDADLDDLKWHTRGEYAGRTIHYDPTDGNLTRCDLLHRVVAIRAGMEIDGLDVDHIDRDKMNCRRSNLRPATRSQNKANSPKPSSNTSGFKGVRLKKGCKTVKYEVRIKCGQAERQVGTFTDIEEAARAYDRAALEAFGEFAYLNFPQEKS